MIPIKRILISSGDTNVLGAVSNSLDHSIAVDTALSFEDGLSLFSRTRYDLIFIDIRQIVTQPGQGSVKHYEKILSPVYKIYPTAEVVVMAPQDMTRDAVYFVKAGASDYLSFPVNPSEISFIMESIYERNQERHELNYLRDQVMDQTEPVVAVPARSVMKQVYSKVFSVAKTKTTVLLHGESGTGKTLIAGMIHTHSMRHDKQFINVHCGAIPDSLIESEFFGHEKGAFTGAIKRKMGKFEIANNGTLFLDEIGTITPSVQIKLLKVLQDKTFQRIGGEADIRTDIRIIAASNANLSDMVSKGEFRNDLFYRLNVFPIEIPPLRERRDEIEELTLSFLNRMNVQYSKDIHGVHPLVLEAFHHYSWPGNIRELENLVERAYILETSNSLTPESFPVELFEQDLSSVVHVPMAPTMTIAELRKNTIEDIERQYLKELLSTHMGRISLSATVAGISPRQLHKLLKKYDINKNDFK